MAQSVVLTLQGGGALGAYQAGVEQALAEAGLSPDWVAGVSIGSINAALIAGNPPERRVEHLREFWDEITSPTALWPDLPAPLWQTVTRNFSAAEAILFGQPGFFRPRAPIEWFSENPPVSFYDTSELRSTLERLVDFDLINSPGGVRLSVGAVDVETGNMSYFDTAGPNAVRIGPEHIMASGALPPGLATVEVAGKHYWDGGLVSNTPLQYIMDQEPRAAMLVFQVDLFPASGPLPENLDQVAERQKDIQYSSRTRAGTRIACLKHDQQAAIAAFLDALPTELRDNPVARRLGEISSPPSVDIVHLIYRPDTPQGAAKDYEFARSIIQQRWQAGLDDARATLAAAPWKAPAEPGMGVRVFDVTRSMK